MAGVDDDVLASVWAKTHWDDTEPAGYWLPLWQHLDDSGGVAGKLWDHWLPATIRTPLADAFGGADEARRAVTFLAGVHDIGKATPAFAVQARNTFSGLSDDMRALGLSIPAISDADRRTMRHDLTGQVLLENWLCERFAWSPEVAPGLGVVVGGHHGIPPDEVDLAAARRRPRLLGEGLWCEAQLALLERASTRFGVAEALTRWRERRLSQPVQVLLTGVVITADWIASNADFFPLVRLGDQPDRAREASCQRLDDGWRELAIPAPWRPLAGEGTATERVQTRFDLPPDAQARPIQEAALAAATAMDVPGLLVIEAPMGEGKTEAALLAAEVLAERSGAGGCFVALPTQATTDAMFERVLRWLERLPDAGDAVSGTAHSLALSHGKAWFSQTFRELSFGRSPVGIAQDHDAGGDAQAPSAHAPPVQAFVHRWTSGRKRAALADFVVGTIDQLLFVSLKARHLMLRHLGMARKVVIVDEVHAYDAYMSSYLSRALEWLGAYGTPVVLLSATLPRERRDELLAAYECGRASLVAAPKASRDWRALAARPGRDGGTTSSEVSAPDLPHCAGPAHPHPVPIVYPAVTYRRDQQVITTQVAASGRSTEVGLQLLDDEVAELGDYLAERLSDGGCALVVRNTVRRVQETASHLRERFGDDVHVVHARFISHHRLRNDEWLRATFGPPGGGAGRARASGRPHRAIVVGSQVVEQSLDIDFDLLVTDLAPIDIVLQRIGRLHRHRRGAGESGRPAGLRQAHCVITGVASWSDEPPALFKAAEEIYWAHQLYRAAALLTERAASGSCVSLPDDIAGLVEAAYGDAPLGPEPWQPALKAAEAAAIAKIARKRASARDFQIQSPGAPGSDLRGWLHADIGEADDDRRGRGRAQVRDGDDSVEVLLLRRDADGQLRIPDGDHRRAREAVPTDLVPSSALATAVAGCAVRLPAWTTRGDRGDQLINELERRYWYPAWQKAVALEGQLVMPLDEAGLTVAGLHFTYDARTGLEVA